MCIKGLRLVTVQLPEKFSPVELGTNRSSPIRCSTNFAFQVGNQCRRKLSIRNLCMLRRRIEVRSL